MPVFGALNTGKIGIHYNTDTVISASKAGFESDVAIKTHLCRTVGSEGKRDIVHCDAEAAACRARMK